MTVWPVVQFLHRPFFITVGIWCKPSVRISFSGLGTTGCLIFTALVTTLLTVFPFCKSVYETLNLKSFKDNIFFFHLIFCNDAYTLASYCWHKYLSNGSIQGVPKLNDNLRPDERPSYTSPRKIKIKSISLSSAILDI